MAHLLQSLYSAARPEFSYLGRSGQGTTHRQKLTWNRFPVIVRCASTESLTSLTENAAEIELKHLVSQHGWDVRRLNRDDEDEIRRVSLVQAEAFHIPLALFNDFFFMFFQAEVLSALLYKLKNSPPDRYACLVAKQTSEAETCSSSSVVGVVGVVDITAQTESSVLCHFPGVEEYLYVSGLAVSKAQRRKKMGSTLLKACDVLCYLWGFKLLALRAYEDDAAARNLYSNAGYEVVATDPLWTSTWIGRKRRVLMTKRFS